jgi:hypothetical protein
MIALALLVVAPGSTSHFAWGWDATAAAQRNYFQQRVDHFDAGNNATWMQAFYVNATCWGGRASNAPVFMHVGGENAMSESQYGISHNFINDVLPDFRGLEFALEHRYYGCWNAASSCPTNTSQMAEVDLRTKLQRLKSDDRASVRVRPARVVANCSTVTDCTAELQRALDSCAMLVELYPLGSVPWVVQPLFVRCNQQRIVLHPGLVLEAKRGAFAASNSTLLTIDNVFDVSIVGNGAVLRMWRSDYHNSSVYRHSEHRHGIALLGAQNISLLGLTVEETGGDGVYVGLTTRREAQPWCCDITMDSVLLTRNYRQGCSIVAVDGMYVRNSLLSDTGLDGVGTPPMSGVDFEPNRPDTPIQGVLFHNVTVSGNAGRGVEFFLPHFGPASRFGVVLDTCTIENNGLHGIFYAGGGGAGGLPESGSLEFRHLRIAGAVDSGLYIENKNGGPVLVVQNVTLHNVATRTNAVSPLWIGASNSYHCAWQCWSEGASFDGLVLFDSVDRVPLKVQGNVSHMRGLLRVHNPALSSSRCVTSASLPRLLVVCD